MPQKGKLAVDVGLQKRVLAGGANDVLRKAHDMGISVRAKQQLLSQYIVVWNS